MPAAVPHEAASMPHDTASALPEETSGPDLICDYAWYTNAGGCPENQDVLRLGSAGGRAYAVVCDGLGGMAGGSAAAAICTDAITAAIESEDGGAGVLDMVGERSEAWLGRVLAEAHQALMREQATSPALRQARSTAAVVVIGGGELVWATVGDSRVYRFQGGRLAEVSPDDSAGGAAFRRGDVDHEAIRLYDGRSHLTAALGDDRDVTPHTGRATLQDGGAVLVCSDGFWEYVWDLEMEVDLAKAESAAGWLELMLLRLVEGSGLEGDNASVAVFVVGGCDCGGL
ncbi:MAG: protein phosphatase 2C domain-containing protein [Bifidobacteriaceae bacterium]|jgi:serine/threonine protein phosphatase PrpC|nr:protein phosphatase 2C domain-containing protein [Bifidobacteriaceae bacterium]